jgi:competence protein ComEC
MFLGGILFSTVIAGLAVTPLSIYHFHAMQHYAPLANLAAVPICNLVVMPAALATLVAMPFGLEAAPLWIMGWGVDAMGAIARYVAALPGAVTQFAEVSDVAFAMVLAGGLWLVLWQKSWRLAGLPMIVAGLALTGNGARPDLIVGREGSLVAVRDRGGRLAAHAERPSTFELTRWLQHDGDDRDPKAVRRSKAFDCDALGCTSLVGPDMLAVSRHPASIADDCDRARILVVNGARPNGCEAPLFVLDRESLRTSGTVAFHRMADGTYVSRSVAAYRGLRPWSVPPPDRRAPRQREPGAVKPGPPRDLSAPMSAGGVGRYAAQNGLLGAIEASDELRPEIEDDDAP